MARGPAFEPRLTESESAVLPLNYPRTDAGANRVDIEIPAVAGMMAESEGFEPPRPSQASPASNGVQSTGLCQLSIAMNPSGSAEAVEIRTHEALASPPVFKTGAFNRSATPLRSPSGG